MKKIMSEYRVGVSYYPEWWPEEEWETDFAKMEAMGINTVRMGEFAWSWYEPRDGEFNLEPMKRAVDLAASHGIKVIMCTTSAICPPWLYKKHPEVKGGNITGKYTYGGRKGNCLSSDILRKYVARVTEEQAKALGNHPNIIGWQLDNEPGFPFAEYDELCEKKFRLWLKERYGTIDRLNDEWFNMFWSNLYNDFDEITFPTNSAEGAWTPGLFLATRRFFSDNFNSILNMEADILRKYIGKDIFLFTNWPGANWSVSCFDGEKYLDYAAWDNYVTLPMGEDYLVQLRSAMEHDFDRRLSHGKHRFLVAEQTCKISAHNNPECISAQTWLDVSQGAFGTVFFEWRAPLGGAEQSYGSMLNGDLSYGEGVEPIKRFADQIKVLWPLIDGAETKSDFATLYSYESSWSTPGWTVDGPYDQDFFNIHGAFRNQLKRDLDVVGIQDDLSSYRMISAPGLRICTEEQADKLRSYVASGGILVLSRDCGMFDTENRIYTRNVPGLFRDMCGVNSPSFTHHTLLNKADPSQFSGVEFCGSGKRFTPWKNINKLLIEADDVEVLATYTAGRLKGEPAITLRPWGKGWVVYLAADCDDYRYYMELARVLAEKFGFEPYFTAEDGVLVSRRIKDGREIFFAVNMTESDKKAFIPKGMVNCLTGEELGAEVMVPFFNAVVFTKK